MSNIVFFVINGNLIKIIVMGKGKGKKGKKNSSFPSNNIQIQQVYKTHSKIPRIKKDHLTLKRRGG